ncbi:MAG: hypothetical protein QOH25_244 [Acidobacteriota bacterium]|jgi:uncharacterized membrane protein|nr:hypothetical protein [Acidobacteriota bacterium]
MERTEKSIEINAPVGVVFDLYSDFEKFPEWMEHIKEVRQTEPRFTKWAADAPLGINVEWEAETTEFEPNRKIAWRTVRGDVEMQGEVTFEETGRGATVMHISLAYEPPAGHLGTLLAKFFGNDPEKQMDEDLQRFIKLAEGRAKKRQRRGKKERPGESPRSSKRRAA